MPTPLSSIGTRALYAGLAELRLDLMKHVSLENDVLFPAALALESKE